MAGKAYVEAQGKGSDRYVIRRENLDRHAPYLNVENGFELLNDLKAKCCFLVGHPQYYRQFGFKNVG